MASKVKFTDGTTTVTFDGTTDGKVVTYDILTPTLNTLTVSKVSRDGTEMIAQAYQDVTETLELYVAGTWSQITTTIRKLNRLWERVRRQQANNVEASVYIEVQPDGDSDYWRSELKSVITDLEPQALDLYLGQGKVVFSVTVTREFFWEKETETELSLYNPHEAKGTGGKTVYNCNDAYTSLRYNYLDIDNSDLVGDLPARIRLKLTNSYNDATRLYNIFVGLAFSIDSANFGHAVEGEAGELGTQKPVSADYTNYSGGYYMELAWSGTAETTIGRWNISSAALLAAKSNYFMIYVKATTSYTDLFLRPKITALDGGTTLWLGPQVLVPSDTPLVCLGAFQLPPVRQITGTPFPEELTLTAQRATSGSHTYNVDWIYLCPMERWRQYNQNQYGLAYQTHLVDDAPRERLYTDGWTPAGNLYNFVGYGPLLEVTPVPESTGKHRLSFFMRGGSYCLPDRTLTVEAWYRPRRKQI